MNNNMAVFNEVFPDEILKGLEKKAKTPDASEWMQWVALCLDVDSKIPPCHLWRRHLSRWLDFCKSRKGLDKDKISRLRGFKNCLAWFRTINRLSIPWFLSQTCNMSIEYVKACQQPTPDVCCITGDGFKFNMEITTPGKETPEEKAKCKEFEGITPLRACIKEKLKNGQFIKGQPNVLAIGIQNHPNWGCLSDLCNSMHEALFGHGKGILLNGKAKQIGTILCFDTQVRHNHKDKFVYAVNVFRMPSPEISIPPEVFKGLKQYQYDENGERTKLGICGKEEFVFD